MISTVIHNQQNKNIIITDSVMDDIKSFKNHPDANSKEISTWLQMQMDMIYSIWHKI